METLMQRTYVRLATVAGLAFTTLAVSATSALAHEQRTVGKYHVEVGFGTEPAYVGFPNSVQLLLNDAHDNPVTNLGDTLKVVVIQGSQHKTLSVAPNFEVGGDGIPGDYRAWFIPTTAGVYTFHFTGTVK